MLDVTQLILLHTNQRLVVDELQRRGVTVRILSLEHELLEATYNGHKELLLDRDFSATSYPSSAVCGNKALTKELLRGAGFKVPKGDVFDLRKGLHEPLAYSQTLRFPLVVKPSFGSHGDNVFTDLDNIVELKESLEVAKVSDVSSVIVEEHFRGDEYRIFINKNGDYAVLHRDPAHVIGNGQLKISTLIDQENTRRALRLNSLCPIVIDAVASQYLSKNNISSDSVPVDGQKVYLRPTSNVAKGGVCVDFTNEAHPSAVAIAKDVLQYFPGLPYVGIDFMSKDVTKKQNSRSYSIIEVNTVPGVHMHMRPGIGKSQNVASYISDMMFPETRGKYVKA